MRVLEGMTENGLAAALDRERAPRIASFS